MKLASRDVCLFRLKTRRGGSIAYVRAISAHHGSTRKIGSYSGDTTRLNEVAAKGGAKYLTNVAGRETPLTGSTVG